MLSTFFNKSSRTSVAVLLLFAVLGCTWYAVKSNDVGVGARLAASLVPTNALTLGLLDIANQGASVRALLIVVVVAGASLCDELKNSNCNDMSTNVWPFRFCFSHTHGFGCKNAH